VASSWYPFINFHIISHFLNTECIMYYISRRVDVTASLCIIVLVTSSLFISFQSIGNSQCNVDNKTLYFPVVIGSKQLIAVSCA
jgi:hypothetical protein